MDNSEGNKSISRADLEKALWELTGWQGDQSVIDGILIVHDAVAAGTAEMLAAAPANVREGYYHALVTMAEAIMDTGGQTRLVSPAAAPVLRADGVDELAEHVAHKVLTLLPEYTHRADDQRLLADPALQESLPQMQNGYVVREYVPSSAEVQAADELIRLDEELGLADEPMPERVPEAANGDELMIRCTDCSRREGHDVYLPASNFWKDKKGANGYKSKCVPCAKAAKRAA